MAPTREETDMAHRGANVGARPAMLLAIGIGVLVSSACGLFATVSDPTTPPAAPSLPQRIAAASTTAQRSTGVCADIAPFYWEIGDGVTANGSGAVLKPGSSVLYTAQSEMPIDAASSWMYAAYVIERRRGVLTAEDIQFLTQQSGYTSIGTGSCNPLDTVEQCRARGSNGVLTAANTGKFFYDAGHLQTHASLAAPGMNLGSLGTVALADEIRRVLGTDIRLTYTQPLVASGVRTTPRDYALFLRKIISRQLLMTDALGTSAVCTAGAFCQTAAYSPYQGALASSYSLGHWTGGIGPNGRGVLGFYPWINGKFYGIIARADSSASGITTSLCGSLLWNAWVTGVAQ